jgi:hypothetical protein
MYKRFIIANNIEEEIICRRCQKCDSYRIYKDECLDCGYKDDFFKNNIINNIEKYGFKKLELFNIWKLGNIRVKSIKKSTNMTIIVKNKPEIIINRYGDFTYFKPYLDKIIGIDNKRDIVLNKLLKSKKLLDFVGDIPKD